MMEKTRAFLPKEKTNGALRKLSKTLTLLAPVQKWENPLLELIDEQKVDRVVLDKRLASVRQLFLPAVEPLLRYSPDLSRLEPQLFEKSMAVLGLRACDLRGLQLLDRVFLEEPVDEHYRRRRERIVLISLDCTEPWEVCFCTRLGYTPYPKDGFDLNLSPVEGGMIVELGSPKGLPVFEALAEFTREVTPEMLEQREENRKRAERKLQGSELRGLERVEGLGEDRWKEFSRKCVECGACLNICPTCYCFSLSEKRMAEELVRLRFWEPCILEGYQKVAAGVNPRPELHSRLANRVLHKFAYYYRRYGTYACTGCGRCIEACLGNIDLRELLEAVQ
jgi:ferredoxin